MQAASHACWHISERKRAFTLSSTVDIQPCSSHLNPVRQGALIHKLPSTSVMTLSGGGEAMDVPTNVPERAGRTSAVTSSRLLDE